MGAGGGGGGGGEGDEQGDLSGKEGNKAHVRAVPICAVQRIPSVQGLRPSLFFFLESRSEPSGGPFVSERDGSICGPHIICALQRNKKKGSAAAAAPPGPGRPTEPDDA